MHAPLGLYCAIVLLCMALALLMQFIVHGCAQWFSARFVAQIACSQEICLCGIENRTTLTSAPRHSFNQEGLEKHSGLTERRSVDAQIN